jgi:hypothetical protein
MDSIADEIFRRRIEALAWILVNGTLEVKVALSKRTFLGLGNGIYQWFSRIWMIVQLRLQVALTRHVMPLRLPKLTRPVPHVTKFI